MSEYMGPEDLYNLERVIRYKAESLVPWRPGRVVATMPYAGRDLEIVQAAGLANAAIHKMMAKTRRGER